MVNAEGGARRHLRRLAMLVVQQLLDPSVEYGEVIHGVCPEDTEVRRRRVSWSDPPSVPEAMGECESLTIEAGTLAPYRPQDSELAQVLTALETCTTEFAQILIEEWKGQHNGPSEYRARVEPESMLSGSEEA